MKDILEKILRGPIRIYNENLIRKIYNRKMNLKPLDEKEKTLVFVPHVDDEVIGLGAYLLQCEKEHLLLYSTDSGGSLSDSDYDEIAEERFSEALMAAKAMGIEKVETLGINEDTFIEGCVEKQALLKKIIEENQFHRIFTVSPYDNHPIHRETTKLLLSVMDSIPEHCRITLYEVSNLMPRHWITSYFPMNRELFREKKRLYSYFPSQTGTMDFDIFQRLNRAKGRILDNHIYAAEFFSDLSKEEFSERMISFERLDIPSHRIGYHRSFRKTQW